MKLDPLPPVAAPNGWTIRTVLSGDRHGLFAAHSDALAVRDAILSRFTPADTTVGTMWPADLVVEPLPDDTSPLPLNVQWLQLAGLPETAAAGIPSHFERYSGASGAMAGTDYAFGAICACSQLFLAPSEMLASSLLTEHARRERGEIR